MTIPMRATALLLGCIGLGGLACTQSCSAQPRRKVAGELGRPLIFAHRGGGGEAPESTLQAMQGALSRDPAVVIELDVHRSRDGVLVVIHDATVDRTTNGSGRVANLTWAELRALDAGHCATPGRGRGTASRSACRADTAAASVHFPFRGKGYGIPRLADVLSALPRTTAIGIEAKEPGYEQELATLLKQSGRPPRLFLGSAHDQVAARLRALLPDAWHYFPRSAATRLTASAKLSNGALSRPDYDVLVVPREAMGLRLDTPGMIAAAHRMGLLVAFFTINDDQDMETLVRRGADGIITDYPGRARVLIDRLAGKKPDPAAKPAPLDSPPAAN